MKRSETACYILASICLAFGLLMRFVFTAVRFTGSLFLCAAVTLVVFALLTRWKERRRWALWARRVLLALLAAGTVFFAVLEIQVISWGRTDHETPVAAVVVLGAGVNGTEPSLSLLTRLEAALDYVQDKPDIPVIVSGAQGRGEAISEAQCMAGWLTSHGVPPEQVILEEQATTTKENISCSKALLAEHGIPEDASIAIVSSDYHLCRAAWMWGEGVVPVAARMPGKYFPLTINYYIREAFGLAAAMAFGM